MEEETKDFEDQIDSLKIINKQTKINVPIRSAKFKKQLYSTEQQTPDLKSPSYKTKAKQLESLDSIKRITKDQNQVDILQEDKSQVKASEDLVFAFEDSCQICNQAFNQQFNRHHCRWCGKSVCKDHGSQLRPKQQQGKIELQRICTFCDEQLILNDPANKNISSTNDQLKRQLDQIKSQIQSKEQEIREKLEKIKQQEEILTSKEYEKTQKEQNLRKLLQEEQEKQGLTKKVTENLKVALEQCRKGEKITEELNQKYQQDLDQTKKSVTTVNKELEEIKSVKEKVLNEIANIKEQLIQVMPKKYELSDNNEEVNQDERQSQKSRTSSHQKTYKRKIEKSSEKKEFKQEDLVPSFKGSQINNETLLKRSQASKSRMQSSYNSGCSSKCLIM